MSIRMRTLWAVLLVVWVSACGGPSEVAPTSAPAVTPTGTGGGFITAIPVVSTRTDRRAPTLAPTGTATAAPPATETQVPPSETAEPTATTPPTTVPPSATRPAVATNTARPLPTRTLAPATATLPPLAPAVYVTAIQVDPAAPKSNAEFLFHVSFLNTVGTSVNYPHWRVLILPQGQTKAVGDPAGTSKTIAAGALRQDTQVWKINVRQACQAYTGLPIWEMEDGRQVPFLQPNGASISINFQVCP